MIQMVESDKIVMGEVWGRVRVAIVYLGDGPSPWGDLFCRASYPLGASDRRGPLLRLQGTRYLAALKSSTTSNLSIAALANPTPYFTHHSHRYATTMDILKYQSKYWHNLDVL